MRNRSWAPAVTAAGALLLAGCGSTTTGQVAPDRGEAPTGRTVVAEESETFPDPCDGGTVDCVVLGGVDMTGDGDLDGVAVTVRAGLQTVTVRTSAGELLWASVPEQREDTVWPGEGAPMFVELDEEPGAEIVLPTGVGTDAIAFAALTVADGELRPLAPPGPLMARSSDGGWEIALHASLNQRLVCTDKPGWLDVYEQKGQDDPVVTEFRPATDGLSVGEASGYVVGRKGVPTNALPLPDGNDLADWIACATIDPTGTAAGEDSTSDPFSDTAAGMAEQACDRAPDLDSAVVRAAIAEVPRPEYMPDGRWMTTYAGNYTDCDELTYAVVTVEDATASSPEQVLLFHEGEFVGVTRERCPMPLTDVSGDGEQVTVTYRGQDPQGSSHDWIGAPVTYTWDDGQVVADGTVPVELQPGCVED